VEITDAGFRAIVDSIGLPILVIAGDGEIRYAGGSVERDFGWTPEQLVGRNVIEFTTPEEVAVAIESLGDLLNHNLLGIGVPTVFSIVRADGSLTCWAVGAVPLFDQPGVEGITLFFLPWDAQRQFDDGLAALLAGDRIDVAFAKLGQGIVYALEAVGASVHWGFDGERFAHAASVGIDPACYDLDAGPWYDAVTSGEPRYVATSVLPEAAAAAAAANGLAGCWSIPVPPTDGVEPAVLTVWREVATNPVTAHDFMIARALRYVQLALVRRAEHQKLARLASHDTLTGAVNRAEFHRQLQAALLGGGPVAVLFCDLDRFKPVNDSYGHATGDAVLVVVADRFRASLGATDVLARLGGDEFTVLVDGDEAEARRRAEVLVAAIDEPIDVGETTVTLGLSVGIAVATSEVTADELLLQADVALYEAKRAGGGVRVAGG
jgi:diguanylate cyclase (GGDEF)-like protein/PAS domain S-box-containing protein